MFFAFFNFFDEWRNSLMKIEGSHIFNAPRETVWTMFCDPAVLTSALPGAQNGESISAQAYKFDLNGRTGQEEVFSGGILFEKAVSSHCFTVKGKGRAASGFVDGVGNFQLVDHGAAATLMMYEGEVNVGGAWAGIGPRMFDTVSNTMIQTGLTALDQSLAVRSTAKAGTKERRFEVNEETTVPEEAGEEANSNAAASAEVKLMFYIVPIVLVLGVLSYLLGQ
jgi:carbon monoxide dehydrogenase subunit G